MLTFQESTNSQPYNIFAISIFKIKNNVILDFVTQI